MAVMSGTLGFGGGTGLVVVGLLMSGDAGYHRVFWLTTAFTVARSGDRGVPRAPTAPRANGSIDWLGAVGLARGAVGGLAGDHPGQLVGLGVTGARSPAPSAESSC